MTRRPPSPFSRRPLGCALSILALLPLAPGCTPSHPTSSVATPTTKPTANSDPMTAYRTESEQARRAYVADLSLATAAHAARVQQADRTYAAARQRALEDLTTRRSAAADRVIADYDRRIARLQSAGQSDAAIAAQVAREQFRASVEADDRRDTDLATLPTTHPTTAAVQVLDLQATIDGSDELRITPAGLQWTHKSWDPPTNIFVNGHAWNHQDGPLPLDRAGLTLTPDDFRHGFIRVLSHSGRDTVGVQPDPDAVTVFFSDDENGSAPYHVRIQFLRATPANAPPPSP